MFGFRNYTRAEVISHGKPLFILVIHGIYYVLKVCLRDIIYLVLFTNQYPHISKVKKEYCNWVTLIVREQIMTYEVSHCTLQSGGKTDVDLIDMMYSGTQMP